tara:strand:+ start:941 stop:6091 length:5151 start_codon:yes stop_codon:yes gene_type:complete
MLNEEIVPSTEEPIPVATPEFQEQAPEDFPEAEADPFIAAEEEVTEDAVATEEPIGDSGIDPNYEIPSELEEDKPLGGTEDDYISLAEPEAAPLEGKSAIKAKETSYYATQELELEGEIAEAKFNESSSQQITEGRSDLEDQALEAAAQSNIESDEIAIESIVADSSLEVGLRKNILKTYMMTGSLPVTLKERFINRKTMPIPSSPIADIIAQENILETIEYRKNDQHRRVRNEEIDSVDPSYWDSFAQGGWLTLMQISETTGIPISSHFFDTGVSTPEDVKAGMAEAKRIQELGTGHAIVQGLGGIAPQLVAAVGAGVAAPALGLGTLTTMGVVFLSGGTPQALARYSQLGVEGVNEETRRIASLQEGVFFGVETSLPFLKAASFLKSVILNGGATLTFDQLSLAAQNRILEAYPELQRRQFDPTDMTVSALMGGIMGAIFSKRTVKTPKAPTKTKVDEDMEVPASSVADSEKVANPKEAAKDAAETIATNDAKAADVKTGGKGMGSYLHDWVNPKSYNMTDAGEQPLLPDAAAALKAWFARADAEMRDLFTDTRFDANVQNATKRYEDLSTIHEIQKDFGSGPKYDQPNSKLSITDDLSEGQEIYTPRSGGVYKTEAGALREMKKLQRSIDGYTATKDGKLSLVEKDGGYVVAFDWKLNYDPLSMGRLAIEPITILGGRIDVTAIARSRIGNHIFDRGRHKKAEQGAFRGVETSARIANTFHRNLNDAISTLKHKAEFETLVRDSEELGKSNYTIMEITEQFPNLKRAEAENLAVVWSKWRRIVDYQYNFTARQHRNGLAANGYRGIHLDGKGKPVGTATEQITPEELSALRLADDAHVWDYETGQQVKYDKQKFEDEGRTLVKMLDVADDSAGQAFEYAILGSKAKLHTLPEITLPKVEGWSPRVTKENWFIDIVPKEYYINGSKITDPDTLWKKKKNTVGASRTEAEGLGMKAELEKSNPDMRVVVRRERGSDMKQIEEAMEIQGGMLREAKRKGERLQSPDGSPARLEDSLVSLQKSIDLTASTEAFTQWDRAFQSSFLKEYSHLLDDGLFPKSQLEISMKGEPSRIKELQFADAQRLWKYYYTQKQMKTYGDFQWEAFFHHQADLLEKYTARFHKSQSESIRNMARNAPDSLRALGDQGNIVFTKWPKGWGSALYIHLNVPRQHIIQPAQVREMWVVNPGTADNSFLKAQSMRFLITSMDKFQNVNMDVVKTIAGNKGTGRTVAELVEDFKAIKRSGLLDSMDRNELVRDVFNDSQAMLVESGWGKAGRRASNVVTKPIGFARKIGFDAGEMSNRLGMWYQARELWQQQNPKKNWRTLENQEIIAAEGVKLSGAMSRAGSLPYQRGFASVLFQFMAISHKLTMNILQDGATIMTPALRSKLAAARLTAYGFHAGLPAAGLLAYSYDLFDGDPLFDDYPELRRVLEHGVLDYAVNTMINKLWDDEDGAVTDLAIADSLTPYNPLLFPYISTAAEWYKLIDGSPSTNPRFPIVSIAGSVGKTMNNLSALFGQDEDIISDPEKFKQAAHEIAQLSSGYKNATKAVIMASTESIISSNGNDLGISISTAESFGKFLGFRTQKEINNWEGVLSIIELKAVEKDLVEGIHEQWVYISKVLDKPEGQVKFRAMGNLFDVLKQGKVLSPDSIGRIKDAVIRKDLTAFSTGVGSLLAELYKYNHDEVVGEMKKLARTIQDSKDPNIKEWYENWKNRDGL